MKYNPADLSSSGESWTMSESLIQRDLLNDEGVNRKVLLLVTIMTLTKVISPGQLRASSRGNTGGTSVILIIWRKAFVGDYKNFNIV